MTGRTGRRHDRASPLISRPESAVGPLFDAIVEENDSASLRD
jgi:hypothetical protein